MYTRPKPCEDEEDILRMQEEFIREKNKNKSVKPSAQVVNLRRTEHQTIKRATTSQPGTRKPSKYAESKGLNHIEKRSKNEPTTSIIGDILEKNMDETSVKVEDNDDKVYFPNIIPSVLGNIVEKNSDSFFELTMDPMPSTGFPTVTKLSKTDSTVLWGGKSIHAIEIGKNMHNKIVKEMAANHMDVDGPSEVLSVLSSSNPACPTVLDNPISTSSILSNKDKDNIHVENLNILNKMSEKEILKEQQTLMSSIDPKLVEFLKTRRKQSSATSKGVPSVTHKKEPAFSKNVQGEEMETEDKELDYDDDTLWDNDILSHPEINNWLHFDSLEKDKLQWMRGIKENNKTRSGEPYEARFNFKGYLLPYTIEYTEKTKPLFHHGEEPHRPGYSVTELIELSRSSAIQQKIMALNTIAGLLEYYSAGTYHNVIEIPMTKLFFVVRFAMDENKVTILEPALKGMRNLLYNRIDEACLDALIGFEEGTFQPCLENDKFEIEEIESKESELKDFHLAEIDIIAAILRTDILQRLYYITDVIRPGFNCVQYSMQILTRLVRDSVETANMIIQTDHLMNAIIRNFFPITGINFTFSPGIAYKGKPILGALKLIRVLSLQSREIGQILISKYDILRPVSEYITSGVDGTYGLRLQMESYCILSNLIHYDLGIDYAIALFPVIVTTLYKHVQGTDIFVNTVVVSSTHAAVVLQLVDKMFNCELFDVEKFGPQVYPLIKEGLVKWMAQAASTETYTCGHMRVLCSVLDCCKTILNKTHVTLPFLNNSLQSLSKSVGIRNIVKNLIPSSNLMSGIEERHLNNVKNLVNLRGVVIDSQEKVLPVLNVTSPMPFLVSLFRVLASLKEKYVADPYIELIQPYLRKFIKSTPTLTSNWFTRIEIEFIFNAIRFSLQSNMAEGLKDVIYAVANKLSFILRVDKQGELQWLLDKVIFNKEWFTAERLFNLISLSEADGFSKILTSIEEIKKCYSTVVKLNILEEKPSIAVSKWKQPILPRDWIYLPILSLYSKSQETPATTTITGDHAKRLEKKIEEEQEIIVRCSLEWIMFNELCFPDLLNDIDVTDKFCRVTCVFLCHNSLFLDEKIKILLHNCIKILFKRASEFNFDKHLTGLNNFQDFYTQLLEQFQSVSYGDYNFAACVLVPLAQHHNVKWRKILWSEYAGCLRALDCPESYLCYELNKYLYPEETEESLIKCYFRALTSNLLRPDTLVHKIASHHVQCFKKRMNVVDCK